MRWRTFTKAILHVRVSEHPLREQFWSQLMLALYRCGRPGEALQAFRTAREHIAEQLGVEPGAELQAMHRGILTADPRLSLP
jgi:DNA-binding SARP family transcriptional activator